MASISRRTTAAFLSIFLAACGGGSSPGSSSASPASNPSVAPVANGTTGTAGPVVGDTDNSGSTTNPATTPSASASGNAGSTGGSTPPAGSGGATDPASSPATTAPSDGGSAVGTVSTVAVAESARFNTPTDIKVDGAGNLYVMDSRNQRIRKIAATGGVSTLAGNVPTGSEIVTDLSGNLFVSAAGSGEIYRLGTDGSRTSLATFRAQPGTAGDTSSGLSIDALGRLYVLYAGRYPAIHRILANGSHTQVFAGSMYVVNSGLASDANGNLALGASGPQPDVTSIKLIPQSAQPATVNSPGTSSIVLQHNEVDSMVFDAAGNLYIADARYDRTDDPQNGIQYAIRDIRVIRRAADGTTSILFSGLPKQDTVMRPLVGAPYRVGIAIGANGTVYLADASSHAIYRIGAGGEAVLVAGKPGEAGFAD